MSGMTVGSILEADRRLRDHGAMQRRVKKSARDAEVWRRYEEDFEQVANANANAGAAGGAGDGRGEGERRA